MIPSNCNSKSSQDIWNPFPCSGSYINVLHLIIFESNKLIKFYTELINAHI